MIWRIDVLLKKNRMNYDLHFNEVTQKFYIIPNGVTITPAKHGESVLSSPDSSYLLGLAKGIMLFGPTELTIKHIMTHRFSLANVTVEILED